MKSMINNPLRLDFGDIKYSPSKNMLDQLAKELKNINLYPRNSYAQLKVKLAKYCGVKPENIILTNGSDEAIDLITTLFGKTVLIPAPTFLEYEYAAKRSGCKFIIKNCLDQIRNK